MTTERVESKWELQRFNMFGGGGNSMLRPKDDKTWGISYQPRQQLSGVFGLSIFNCETSQGETAICVYEPHSNKGYYMLNGDWRDDYEKLIDKGLDACLEFYESKKDEFGSSWSTRR